MQHSFFYSKIVVCCVHRLNSQLGAVVQDAPGYKSIEAALTALAETATSDEEFIEGFRDIWKNGPFSHVELRIAHQSADDLAAYLDTLRIGGGGAVLTWQDNVAGQRRSSNGQYHDGSRHHRGD
jgi:hypothetical protein